MILIPTQPVQIIAAEHVKPKVSEESPTPAWVKDPFWQKLAASIKGKNVKKGGESER